MAVYASDDQFYTVMKDVFARVVAAPDHVDSVARSNLVIRIKTTDPEAQVLIDGRQPPMEVFFGERPGAANVEVTLPAELLHSIWLGKESTADSFFSGKIKTQGSLLKMMKLTELFRAAERVYPDVAQEYGLPL